MSQNIVLPKISGKSKSTRDLIISVLSEEWPLSAKQVFERVKKQSGESISYQAVHKVLLQLSGEKILEKRGNDYQLSKDWVAGMKTLFNSLEQRYGGKEAFIAGIAEFKGSFEFTFNDLTDFALRMAEMLLADRLIKSKGSRVASVRHGWWPLKFSFDQFPLLRKITKLHGKPPVIIRNDSPFARWISNQYKLAGFKTKIITGVEDYNDDILICGSLIVQIRYSKETKKAIDELFKKNPTLATLFKTYVISGLPDKKIEIHFKITENPALAATLGKHYMDIWNSH